MGSIHIYEVYVFVHVGEYQIKVPIVPRENAQLEQLSEYTRARQIAPDTRKVLDGISHSPCARVSSRDLTLSSYRGHRRASCVCPPRDRRPSTSNLHQCSTWARIQPPGGATSQDGNYDGNGVGLAVFSLWLLDLAMNASLVAIRAVVADCAPPRQQAR